MQIQPPVPEAVIMVTEPGRKPRPLRLTSRAECLRGLLHLLRREEQGVSALLNGWPGPYGLLAFGLLIGCGIPLGVAAIWHRVRRSR